VYKCRDNSEKEKLSYDNIDNEDIIASPVEKKENKKIRWLKTYLRNLKSVGLEMEFVRLKL
jgi:hypothetical protein